MLITAFLWVFPTTFTVAAVHFWFVFLLYFFCAVATTADGGGFARALAMWTLALSVFLLQSLLYPKERENATHRASQCSKDG